MTQRNAHLTAIAALLTLGVQGAAATVTDLRGHPGQ